jgi:hypothetical protein
VLGRWRTPRSRPAPCRSFWRRHRPYGFYKSASPCDRRACTRHLFCRYRRAHIIYVQNGGEAAATCWGELPAQRVRRRLQVCDHGACKRSCRVRDNAVLAINSWRNCNCFGPNSAAKFAMPVRFAPGRMADVSKRVAARQRRLAAFPGEGVPPRGKACQLLCEDHVGTYILSLVNRR